MWGTGLAQILHPPPCPVRDLKWACLTPRLALCLGTAQQAHRCLWNTGLQGAQDSLVTQRLGSVLQTPTRTKARGGEKAVLPNMDACCRNSFSLPL